MLPSPARNVNCIPTGFWRASGGLLESLREPPVTGRPSDLFRRALMDIAIPDCVPAAIPLSPVLKRTGAGLALLISNQPVRPRFRKTRR